MPLRNQAKLTIWHALKHYAASVPGVEFNEADLMVRYPNGNKLQLFGADNPDALRGPGFSGLSFDEYSQHPGHLFGEVLSKSLADHLGYAIFAGTIKGKDQLFRTYERATGDPDWFALWQDADASLDGPGGIRPGEARVLCLCPQRRQLGPRVGLRLRLRHSIQRRHIPPG
jgi:hypothetical protein